MELPLVLPPLHQQQMLPAALSLSLLEVSPVCSWPSSRCKREKGKEEESGEFFGEAYLTMSVERIAEI